MHASQIIFLQGKRENNNYNPVTRPPSPANSELVPRQNSAAFPAPTYVGPEYLYVLMKAIIQAAAGVVCREGTNRVGELGVTAYQDKIIRAGDCVL